MLECVRSNFGRDAELRQQLLATGDRLLQEGWPVNDGFWGIGPSGKGRSELGKILMRVRAGVQEVQQDEQQTHIMDQAKKVKKETNVEMKQGCAVETQTIVIKRMRTRPI